MGTSLLSQIATSELFSLGALLEGALHIFVERCKANAPLSFENTLVSNSWTEQTPRGQSSINNQQMVSQSLGPSPAPRTFPRESK